MRKYLSGLWMMLFYSACMVQERVAEGKLLYQGEKASAGLYLPESVISQIRSMDAESVFSDLQALADDSMEGRGIGMAGYERASQWVEKRFQENGIRPLFNGSYRQPFNVLKKSIETRMHFYGPVPDTLLTWNVGGFIPGTDKRLRKEWIVVTAHLDHIGRTADSVYAGANDNASGVAAMLHTGIFISKNPLRRSVAFIAFAAEETGLLGSSYFTHDPAMPLEDILLLLNLDLVGSGREGIMIVGGESYSLQQNRLLAISRSYFPFTILTRPNAPNSDHYFFNIAGVPALFLYAYNGKCPYHLPGDRPDCIDRDVLVNITRLTAAVVWSTGMAD